MKFKLPSNLKHIYQQPFVFATGAAALIHSTWSLGTLFSGQQPEAGFSVHFLGWIIPALLIAFALDVGQIATSTEIRENGLTAARGVTFVVFAVATYYLQWLYMAHHMPDLPLSAGVTGKVWTEFAINLRDAGLWLVPALLPLSTILYTFSSNKAVPAAIVTEQTAPTYVVKVEQKEVEPTPLPLSELPQLQAVQTNGNGKHATRSANGAVKRSPSRRGAISDSATTDAPQPTE